MKRILLLMVLLCIGKMAFPDSSFLPGLEFHYLYRDNEFVFGTSERGIPQEEYISFLCADENLLGEKVALISALASYFKWRDIDDEPDNDDENYFGEYTMQFKKKAQERYKDQLPTTVQLLIALMNDYETFSSHTSAYDRLAAELGNSLTAPSVKGIAYGYDILYNRKWDRVGKYEDDYFGPYKANWQTYGEDIHTDVHKKVEEWLFYIHDFRNVCRTDPGRTERKEGKKWKKRREWYV
ncbi:MAG: hypothetical protein LUF85_00480 [Bacteroides sp.]|nr:hypothetical protein [Bacteroides sp.]